jgi:hypothetical protein
MMNFCGKYAEPLGSIEARYILLKKPLHHNLLCVRVLVLWLLAECLRKLTITWQSSEVAVAMPPGTLQSIETTNFPTNVKPLRSLPERDLIIHLQWTGNEKRTEYLWIIYILNCIISQRTLYGKKKSLLLLHTLGKHILIRDFPLWGWTSCSFIQSPVVIPQTFVQYGRFTSLALQKF